MNFAAALAAEPVLEIGGFAILNSMLLGLIASIVVTLVLMKVSKKVAVTPGSHFTSAVEAIFEYIINLNEQILHNRAKAVQYTPLVITLFLFILINNWMGLIPGVGSIQANGEPLLRAFTADLNGTLALAIFSVGLIQVYAIKELGVMGHLKHYFSNQPWNPINLFVGVLEVIGEFSKMLSLSLRLFGNVFAGEVLLGVIASISGNLAPVATLPFYFLEIFVGFIQAFVFTMLTLVFLSIATHKDEDDVPYEEVDQSLETLKANPVTDKLS